MYKSDIITEIYANCHTIVYWIDNYFDFTTLESLTVQSDLIEKISYVFSYGIDYELPFDTPNKKYMEIHRYIMDIFFRSFNIMPITYSNRQFNYHCLNSSIVPSEIGSAWIVMLQRNYDLTLEILSRLDKLYRVNFRRLRRLFINQLHEDRILDNNIKWFGFDESEISKSYRMRLLLEKNHELSNIINRPSI